MESVVCLKSYNLTSQLLCWVLRVVKDSVKDINIGWGPCSVTLSNHLWTLHTFLGTERQTSSPSLISPTSLSVEQERRSFSNSWYFVILREVGNSWSFNVICLKLTSGLVWWDKQRLVDQHSRPFVNFQRKDSRERLASLLTLVCWCSNTRIYRI